MTLIYPPWGCSLLCHPHRVLHHSLHVNQPQLLQVPQSWGLLLWTVSTWCTSSLNWYIQSQDKYFTELCSFDNISQIYIILWMIYSQIFAFFNMLEARTGIWLMLTKKCHRTLHKKAHKRNGHHHKNSNCLKKISGGKETTSLISLRQGWLCLSHNNYSLYHLRNYWYHSNQLKQKQ